MRNRRAPIFAAAAGAVVVLLLVLFLALPQHRSIADVRGQLDQARSQQIQLQTTLASLEEAQSNAAEYNGELRQFENQIPSGEDQPGFINLTKNVAKSAGVDLRNISPGTPQPDPSGSFTVIPTGITVKGSFFAMVEFLYGLETLPRAVKVVNVSVAGQQEGAAGPVNMILAVEFYTTGTSVGQGSGPTQGTPSQGG